MALTEEAQDLIAERLQEVGAVLPCPRCGGTVFSLAREPNPVSVKAGISITNAGFTLPAVILVCSNCGFLAFHAITILGLTDEIFPVNLPSGGPESE
jgi:hypothetical protein